MVFSSVHLGLPPAALFKFPPAPLPQTLPAPDNHYIFNTPVAIPSAVYNASLNIWVPIAIASVYALSVVSMNATNKRRGHKPWAVSKTLWFKLFVLAHNVFLALYSAWTCYGMARALHRAVPHWTEKDGFAGMVDGFCKIHGPPGLGNAITYNSTNYLWQASNEAVKLVAGPLGAVPDSGSGRMWNEGLAFYGWLFYLSKFYEVLDTAIIQLKGKQSSLLQTYHHAGAMMCMWAGIRYMASPIWMFVVVNSAIHGLMYTYFAVTTFNIKVPNLIKRTLTTCQITQFVVGTLFAATHLFVSYDVPVSVAYKVVKGASAVASAASSAAAAAATDPSTSGSLASWFKKLAFRAAGEEGLAENVKGAPQVPLGRHSGYGGYFGAPKEEIRYKTEIQTINCLDTSGEAFAVYLNLMYLVPLTFLFVKFFIKSYLHRTAAAQKARKVSGAHGGHPPQFTKDGKLIEKSYADAIKGVEREVGKQ